MVNDLSGVTPAGDNGRGVLVAGEDSVLTMALARGGVTILAEVRQAELLFTTIQKVRPAAVVMSFPLEGSFDANAVIANLGWLFPELPLFLVGWPEEALGGDGVRRADCRMFPSPPDYRQLTAAVGNSLTGKAAGDALPRDRMATAVREVTAEAAGKMWPVGPPTPPPEMPVRPPSLVPGDEGNEEIRNVGWPAWCYGGGGKDSARSRGPAPGSPSLVIAVCSPKGGVGKTFLSVNLAAAISTRARVEVALLDWDLTSPDVGIHLGMPTGPTLLDLVNCGQDIGPDVFRQHLVPHRGSGVQVLRGPSRPELAEFVSQEHLRAVLLRARATFPVVVVDTSPSPCDEAVCQAVEAAGRIVLVVGQDAACLYQARIFLDLMPRLGVRRETVWVVVNRYQDGPPDVREMQRFLGTTVAAVLPDEPTRASRTIMEGCPLVLSSQPGRLGESVVELAQRIYPTFQMEHSPRRNRRWHPPWRRRIRQEAGIYGR